MTRRFIIYFICLTLCNSLLFFKEITKLNEKFNLLEHHISYMCLTYKETDEINVIYDYEKIDRYLKENLSECNFLNISESEFLLTCEVKKGVFYKVINEYFLIRRGDMYDGRS